MIVILWQRITLRECAFEYPKEKHEIQVLDDSTDETKEITAALVDKLREEGFDIKHIENTWWGIWVNSDNSQNIDEAALVFMYRLLQTKRDTVRLSQYSELLSNKLDRIRKIPGYMLISKIFRKAGI